MAVKNKSTDVQEDVSIYFNPLRFSWHVGGVVAGSARPGRYGDIGDDCRTLREQGIHIIINLCQTALEIPAEYRDCFEVVHEPVIDGHPPEQKQLERIIRLVKKARAGNRKAVVHCRGGVGRTATVLIPLIMEMEGITLDEAVGRLRKAGRYTQTMEQWEFLKAWEEKKQRTAARNSKKKKPSAGTRKP